MALPGLASNNTGEMRLSGFKPQQFPYIKNLHFHRTAEFLLPSSPLLVNEILLLVLWCKVKGLVGVAW